MGYDSIACPKCGVNLSVDDSMRGKKATCPNCSHQMSIPSYQQDSRPNGTATSSLPRHDTATFKTSYSGNSAKAGGASAAPSKTFIISVLMILIILLVSLIVNILMLTAFSTLKTKLATQEPVAFQEPVSIRAESRLPVMTVQSPWEYKVVKIQGEEVGTAPETSALAISEQKIDDEIRKWGAERWELTGVIPQIETVFPNLSEDQMIPAFQPNTRTSSVILIFKRAK